MHIRILMARNRLFQNFYPNYLSQLYILNNFMPLYIKQNQAKQNRRSPLSPSKLGTSWLLFYFQFVENVVVILLVNRRLATIRNTSPHTPPDQGGLDGPASLLVSVY